MRSERREGSPQTRVHVITLRVALVLETRSPRGLRPAAIVGCMDMSKPETPAATLRQFLADHPDGDLVIATRAVGVLGLAWLAKLTEGRNITLLIGETQPQNYRRGANAHRSAAVAFVQDLGVSIRSWSNSQIGASSVDLSIWAVCDEDSIPQHYLVGTAPLTQSGLHEAFGIMCKPDASEIPRLNETLMWLAGRTKEASESLESGIKSHFRPESGWDAMTAQNTGPHDVWKFWRRQGRAYADRR